MTNARPEPARPEPAQTNPAPAATAAGTQSASPSPDVDRLVASLRSRVATVLLWLLAGLGGLSLVIYFPGLLEAASYGTMGFVVTLIAVDLVLARAHRLPMLLRGGWVSLNLGAASIPVILGSGDRGTITALQLGAIFTGTLLLGWKVGLALLLAFTGLIAVAAWMYDAGALPDPTSTLVATDWNSPEGWAGLWSVLVLVAAVTLVATEFLFRQLRSAVSARLDAAERSESALRQLLDERERQAALREQIAEVERERTRLERALAEALEGLQGGFWELELSTGNTTWSDGMYPLLGYAVGEVTPSSEAWRKSAHPDDYARIVAAPITERFTTVFRARQPDGRLRYLRSAISAVFDERGKPTRLRGILTDVTDERATAEQLARMAEVANRTGNAVIITDLEERIEWVNAAFVQSTGWTLDEVRGRRPAEVLQGPHTDAATRAMMRAALDAREPFEVEVLNYARDGRQYWVKLETRLARDAEGVPTGFIAVQTDLTAQRVAERREVIGQRFAALLLQSETISSAAEQVTSALVRELDIRVAQVWLVEPGNPELKWLSGAAAAVCGPAGQEFLEQSRALSFSEGSRLEPGVGVPGVAWGTAKPCVVPLGGGESSDAAASRRRETAANAGFRTFSAAPIVGREGVLGVIEIGTTAHYPGHEQLPQLLERVAEQLAAFLLQDESRRAFETLFAGSPDGLLLVSGLGEVVGANARAAELFGSMSGARVATLLEGGEELVREVLSAQSEAVTHAGGTGLQTLAAHGAEGDFWAEVSASAPSPSRPLAIVSVRDLTERHRMEQALTQSLREKELLLREVHHRVKNNLQIVSSLLTLQSDTTPVGPARDALAETVHRVRSMSLVHQQLYGSDHLDRVDVGDYARTLASTLHGSLDPSARIVLSTDPVEVLVEVAVPCGLILNELITNALKHGRSPDGSCSIEISVKREADAFTLAVKDQGPGVAAGTERSGSLGMQLVRTLARQLRAQLTVESDGGGRFALRIPMKPR